MPERKIIPTGFDDIEVIPITSAEQLKKRQELAAQIEGGAMPDARQQMEAWEKVHGTTPRPLPYIREAHAHVAAGQINQALNSAFLAGIRWTQLYFSQFEPAAMERKKVKAGRDKSILARRAKAAPDYEKIRRAYQQRAPEYCKNRKLYVLIEELANEFKRTTRQIHTIVKTNI